MTRGRRAPAAAPTDPPSRDEGAAALEFALVAPILFALIFMIFGSGWGLWEYQAARASAREAARLASLGIPDPTGYAESVVCLAEINGLRQGSLTTIDLAFHPDATPSGLAASVTATQGSYGYVEVTLTYTSALDGLPLVPWTLGNGGVVDVVSLTRIEQVPDSETAPDRVVSAQTLSATGLACDR